MLENHPLDRSGRPIDRSDFDVRDNRYPAPFDDSCPDLNPPVSELADEPSDWGSSQRPGVSRKQDRGLDPLCADTVPGTLLSCPGRVSERPTCVPDTPLYVPPARLAPGPAQRADADAKDPCQTRHDCDGIGCHRCSFPGMAHAPQRRSADGPIEWTHFAGGAVSRHAPGRAATCSDASGNRRLTSGPCSSRRRRGWSRSSGSAAAG